MRLICVSALASAMLMINSANAMLTKEQKSLILARHNIARGVVQPEAADMQKLQWNGELAAIAQGVADGCTDGHSFGIMYNKGIEVGENLFFTTARDPEIEVGLRDWLNGDEKRWYWFEGEC